MRAAAGAARFETWPAVRSIAQMICRVVIFCLYPSVSTWRIAEIT
jgi:hypothetical protein